MQTGVLLATLDEFVESKSYVVCVLTPDAGHLLVGEPAEIRMFELSPSTSSFDYSLSPGKHDIETAAPGPRRPRPVARFAATYPPSAMAVSADCTWAFVGQSFDCLFSVLDIDLTSSTFGQVIVIIYTVLHKNRMLDNR